MKKVIITAANSFIGRRLCQILTENGYIVYAIVRRAFTQTQLFRDMQNLHIIYADMCEYASVLPQIPDSCDIGIALAWNGTRGQTRNNAALQNENYEFSLKCIESFLALDCHTIITAGSQAEYGPATKTEKIKETDPCNPNTEYGKAKLKLYLDAAQMCTSDIRLIEPRFFSLYGPDDSQETMIISMIRNMLQDKPCMLTECIQKWDFLYIDDAIEALYGLICCENAEGVYNFGSGTSYELKKYVEIMHRITNSKSILNYGAVPYPATGIVHTNPSVERLQKEINWKPKTSFEEGIYRVMMAQKQ